MDEDTLAALVLTIVQCVKDETNSVSTVRYRLSRNLEKVKRMPKK
jgi:hypothetical protein